MKKIMIALVAMFAMTMSANAQSNDNQSSPITLSENSTLTFDRMMSYLDLTIDQVEPVKKAMSQFTASMEALYQVKDASKGMEAWDKIKGRHMTQMKQLLSEKQYEKYEQTFELTAKNTAERLMDQATAAK